MHNRKHHHQNVVGFEQSHVVEEIVAFPSPKAADAKIMHNSCNIHTVFALLLAVSQWEDTGLAHDVLNG
ncbi:unnamed protein product [Strongylus vulgaris]|uniref:Uncharacterized protein n=1 Tax=Strongylus vulgaris TaxID=40348 RepID=A0A3P7ITQ7_STRVU|nr:unnamed protein product [Strongylus vulgaris]